MQFIQPGNIIFLSKPQPTQWKIERIIKEHDNQMGQKYVRDEAPSYVHSSCYAALFAIQISEA